MTKLIFCGILLFSIASFAQEEETYDEETSYNCEEQYCDDEVLDYCNCFYNEDGEYICVCE